MHSFFFCELQLITVVLLIHNSYTSWSTWFISLKLCVGYFTFDSFSFLLNFIFLFNKKHELWLKNAIILFKMKIIDKPQTVSLQDLWYLCYNKNLENSIISAWVGAHQKLTRSWTFKTLKIEDLSMSLFLNRSSIEINLTFLHWINYLFLFSSYLFLSLN